MINKLLEIANNEIGYVEKKSNAYLDDHTANIGTANFTKYWRDLCPSMQGQPWCQCFINWIFVKSFGEKEARELLFQTKGWTFYTPTAASYFQKNNRWYTTSPQIGDIIFFKNSQRICHVGIIVNIDANYLYTIEGNTNGSSGVIPNGGGVFEKKYKLSNTKIAGYGRPDYREDTPKPTTKLKKGVDVSKYNNIKNYLNLKAAGVKFGIIKIIEKSRNVEPSYKKHLNGFLNAGIDILCVYNYTYARTVDDAIKDAQAVLKALDGRRIPVALDVEDKSLISLGEKLIDIIKAYQKVIEDAGLQFILYTGMSYYNSYLKPYKDKLGKQKIWIARYPSTKQMNINDNPDPAKKPQIDGVFMWQYSSSVVIPEACDSRLDCNILYEELGNNPTQKVEEVPQIKVGYVNTHSLKVRNKPDTTGKVLGYLMEGEKVFIYETDSNTGWYRIHPQPNDPHWVSNKYIDVQK